jgi:D-cysteine desulfhydrase
MSPPLPASPALAILPTPLQPLPRLSAELGVDLRVKRDDLTNSHTGGNKLRKLGPLLADALGQGATCVITCGGLQSNHARATALAAASLGLGAHLVLRTPHGSVSDLAGPPTGNVLLDVISGASLHVITPEMYRSHRNAVMADLADRLRAQGERPYVIPEGGSNALGALGYATVVQEILAEMPDGGPDTILAATGSGGTLAGLALGLAAHQPGGPTRAYGVPVCDDAAYFEAIVTRLITEAAAGFGAPTEAAGRFALLDGFQGRGYALTTPEEVAFLGETARRDGLLLDPVYTNKAFRALVTHLREDPRRFGARVVFIHTGGLPGLFAHGAAFSGG